MTDTTYNGWTNYATWRVNLELLDGFNPFEYLGKTPEECDLTLLADDVEEYIWQVVFECGECNPDSLAGSYAQAFLSDVNWYEIAKHKLEEYAN